jgi:hypothetical protein
VGGVFLAKREESADPGEPAPATLERVRAPVTAATEGDAPA